MGFPGDLKTLVGCSRLLNKSSTLIIVPAKQKLQTGRKPRGRGWPTLGVPGPQAQNQEP